LDKSSVHFEKELFIISGYHCYLHKTTDQNRLTLFNRLTRTVDHCQLW